MSNPTFIHIHAQIPYMKPKILLFESQNYPIKPHSSDYVNNSKKTKNSQSTSMLKISHFQFYKSSKTTLVLKLNY